MTFWQRASSYLRAHWQEALVAFALFMWTFDSVVFGSSTIVEALGVFGKLMLGHHFEPLVAALLMIVILSRGLRMSPEGYVSLAVAVGVFAASFYFTRGMSQIVLLLFLLAMQGMRVDVLARCSLVALLLAFALVLVVSTRPSADLHFDAPNGFLVSAYGFGHPNSYGCLLFAISVAMVFSFDLRRTWPILLALCIGSGLCAFFLLSCRTVAVLEAGLSVFVLAYGIWHRQLDVLCSQRWVRVAAAAFPVFLTIVLLILLAAFLQGNELAAALDRMLGARMGQARGLIAEVGGITLFGRQMKGVSMFTSYITTKSYVGADSAYYHYALVDGVTSMVCWACVYVRAMLKGDERTPWAPFVVVAVLYSLYFITETAPTLIAFNCSLLFLSAGVNSGRERAWETGRARVAYGSTKTLLAPLAAAAVVVLALGWTFLQSRSNGTGLRTCVGDFPASTQATLAHANGGPAEKASFEALSNGTMRVSYAGMELTGVPWRLFTRNGVAYYSIKGVDQASQMTYVVMLSKPIGATAANPWGAWCVRVTSSEGMLEGLRFTLNPDGTFSLVSGPYDTISLSEAQLAGSWTVSGTWTGTADAAGASIEGKSARELLTLSMR